MTAEELLLQLKDIQPPPEPAWWLIAPAQLVLAGVIIALFATGWFVLRRHRAGRLAKLAERDFERIKHAWQRDRDQRQFVLKTSRWLKQVALLAFPTRRLESSCGDAWLEFLDQDFEDSPFSRGSGRIFGGAHYAPEVEADATEIIELCERWLNAVKPQLLRRGRS